MSKSVDDLSRVLHQVLRKAEGTYPDQAHRVWEVWDQAVGCEVAERSSPLSLRSGRLTVAVTNAAWMQQLSFLRESIRDAVNRALEGDVVREVRLRMAEVEPPPPPARRPPGPPPWLAEDLPREVTEVVDRDVATIQDPEVREAVRQTRLRAEQIRRFRGDRAGGTPPQSSGRRGRGGRGGS